MAAFVFTPPQPARLSPPEFQFLIVNVAKPANIGNMIRSAVAFGCTTAAVVGGRKMKGFGSQNTDRFCTLNHFDTLEEAQTSLVERGFELVGIEIGNNALSVTAPSVFKGPTCFVFGEEGHGMTDNVKKVCHRFVYIPQCGNGTASLNVSNAAAIIFFQFSQWAKYSEIPVIGEKFEIDETKSNCHVVKDENGNVILSDVQRSIREARAIKRQKQLADAQSAETDQTVSLDRQVDENDDEQA